MAFPYLATDFAPRWSHLTPATLLADMTEGLRRAQAEMEAIAALPAEALTWATTFGAFDATLHTLRRAWSTATHLADVADSPERRPAHAEAQALVAQFHARLYLNEGLYRVLKAFAESPAGRALTGDLARLRDEVLADFRQYGAELPPEKKGRLEALEAELVRACKKYEENSLDSLNAFELLVENEADLAGLPESARRAARESAKAKGLGTDEKPVWRFTLHAPSFGPATQYLDNAELRQKLVEGFAEVGLKAPWDNSGLIADILALRQEKAALLGRAHFADLVTERRMVGSGARAWQFETDLFAGVKPAFDRENAELLDCKRRLTGDATAVLFPWDLAYYSEKLRTERFAFDDEALRPYLPVEKVIGGTFALAQRLFGVVIREGQTHFAATPTAEPPPTGTVEVWHPEVRYYEVVDEATGEALGAFYTDWHPRESKRSGAWMNEFCTGRRVDGQRTPHLGVICGNLSKSLPGQPALLTHDEALTVLHEFGHLIHHLLGEGQTHALTGIHVAWDFVELPSQIMENWAWTTEGLALLSGHFETGAPLPDDLVAKLRASRNFQSARDIMRQLSFGQMDLAMHLAPTPFVEAARAGRLDAHLYELLAPTLTPSPVVLPGIVRRFGHLFGDATGYAAGYYSYKWAEVLDADAFTRFEREGVLNPATGRAFRATVLSGGNTRPPGELFRAFLGRDPDPAALLRRAGLLADAA